MSSHWRESSYHVYLSYCEEEGGGGVVEGQENDAWPDRNPSWKTFEPRGLYLEVGPSQETVGIEFEPEEGQEVTMVVVRYRDGDTFGYTTGNWWIEKICESQEEAKKIRKQIRDGTYPGEYHVWTGYFAGLEEVELHVTTLKGGKCPGIKWPGMPDPDDYLRTF